MKLFSFNSRCSQDLQRKTKTLFSTFAEFPLKGGQLIISPGKYTFSFYAKEMILLNDFLLVHGPMGITMATRFFQQLGKQQLLLERSGHGFIGFSLNHIAVVDNGTIFVCIKPRVVYELHASSQCSKSLTKSSHEYQMNTPFKVCDFIEIKPPYILPIVLAKESSYFAIASIVCACMMPQMKEIKEMKEIKHSKNGDKDDKENVIAIMLPRMQGTQLYYAICRATSKLEKPSLLLL